MAALSDKTFFCFIVTGMKKILGLILMVLLTGCAGKGKDGAIGYSQTGDPAPDSSLTLHYATGYQVDYFKKYKRVTLADPWKKGAVLARYYLVRDSTVSVPADGTKICIPLRSIVSASCTQYTFLDMLGEIRAVAGVCEAKRIYNPSLRKAFAQGFVADLGDPFQIDIEKCLMLKPQALLVNSFNQQDEHVNRLREAGIPVLYDNEWMEPTLLARAEWIRFIACLFDKEPLADCLFREVETNYERLRKKAATATSPKPRVLSGDNFRGTWYQPGGRSFTAQLFAEAGAAYKYRNDTTSGSKPFSFEQVLRDMNQADIWVGVNNGKTLDDLRKLDERYTLFKAFRKGAVYAYTNRMTPDGGNDYWESAVAYPDRLLADFVKLFHPELLPDHSWIYLKKLK
jgi:iron complex transport system substrate-binding protein